LSSAKIRPKNAPFLASFPRLPMPLPFIFRCARQAGLALLLGLPCLAQTNQERLLTDAEIAGLERENAMWRLVRPDEEIEANVARLRSAGFNAREVAAVQPRLAQMWDVPFERNYGWLRTETIEEIQEIDRQFIARMRATRLYEATGIRAGGEALVATGTLTRLWRGALLRALEYDEIAEFRLMNSASAREVNRRVRGLTLTADELRTLFEWQRDYEGRHRGLPIGGASLSAWQRQEQLDEWQRTRDLLGDERFAVYLGRASPAFERMQQALARSGETTNKAALDMWWLRQGYEKARTEPGVRRQDVLKAETRARALALLDEQRLAGYMKDQDGSWLVTPVRQPAAMIQHRDPRKGSFNVPVEKTGTP
jgi:hypothetical protein